MAAEFLLDLTSIDLDGEAVSQEVLDQHLRQTGDMRQLDRVIWLNSDTTSGVGVKLTRPDEFWVPGHIPGRPIFPGVLMIEAAAQLCSFIHTYSGRATGFLGFTRCEEVVFRGQVPPGSKFFIVAKAIELNRRRFISATQGILDGKLVFEARITGMNL